jgi:hypothetical protein
VMGVRAISTSDMISFFIVCPFVFFRFTVLHAALLQDVGLYSGFALGGF